jgi:CTP synthase (UTP-ammonia lyase)
MLQKELLHVAFNMCCTLLHTCAYWCRLYGGVHKVEERHRHRYEVFELTKQNLSYFILHKFLSLLLVVPLAVYAYYIACMHI